MSIEDDLISSDRLFQRGMTVFNVRISERG
jgi:hypothetical protein